MSIREGIRTSLSERGALRAYLIGIVVLCLSLLALWPRGTLEAALRSGQAADTFAVVSVCFLLVLLYLGARFGAEDFTTNPAARLDDYVILTPVPLVSLAAERLAIGVFHTFLLLLLGAPVLIASMAVGGAEPSQAIESLLLVGTASLAARMWGFLALVLLGGTRPLRDMMVFTSVTASAVLTFFLAPAVSPFRHLGNLARTPQDSGWLGCAGASLGASLVLASAALAAMAARRARAKKGGHEA